jgi:translation elongation factor EF-Ts
MEITLEKVELVKDRTGVSYKEAKEALEATDGNVVDAILNIEETINLSAKNKATDQAKQVVENIKAAVAKGNVARIRIKKDEDIVLNLPVNVGIVGTVLAPWAAIIGVIAAFGTSCTIELVKDDGTVVDISEKATDKFGDIKDKSGDVFDSVKEKSSAAFSAASGKAQDVASKVKPAAKEKAEDFKDTVDEMWEEAKKRVSKSEDAAKDAAEDVKEDVKDATEDVKEDVKDAAEEIKEN